LCGIRQCFRILSFVHTDVDKHRHFLLLPFLHSAKYFENLILAK
jgi:hypothetical protein